MNAAQKKRLEEKNAKLIRELAALPANRNCFECGQRGPTYVNITEGSFCCTQCSGILRGLNPPHRVKSISMAAFTTEEVEKLRNLGNAENARSWLGLYGGTPPAMTNRDAIQTFLVKKYEKKTWYVSREELSEQERLMNQAKEAASRTNSHETASVTSNTTNKPSDLDLLSSDPFSLIPSSSSSVQQISAQNHSANQSFSPPAWLAPPPPFTYEDKKTAPAPATANTDLFGLLAPAVSASAGQFPPPLSSNAPFSGPPTQVDPFADFDKKFNDLSVRSSNTVSAFNGLTNATAVNIPKSATVDSGISGLLQTTSSADSNPFQLSAAPLQPIPTSGVPIPTAVADIVPSVKESSFGDKYSALAELDELFHHSGSSGTDGKPAWMPTGFSTGIPPSSTVGNLQQNGVQRPPINGHGGLPKSQTMGAITDYGVNNPFLSNPTTYLSAAFPNPFGTQQTQPGFGTAPVVQQQWNMMNNQQPVIPPRPTPSTTAPTSNWNPFL